MSVVKKISCEDGHPISLTLFEAKEAKAIVIIAAAIGIPQSFYRRYAEYLSEQNYDVVTFNYRGTGDSKRREQKHDIRLEDWGHQDVEAIIRFAQDRKQNNPDLKAIHYIGHSVGGQVVGLAKSAPGLDSLVFVASSAPYWQRWAFPQNLKMLFVGRVMIPGMAMGKKEFPAKRVGLGSINFPSTTAKQWAKWMGRPDYLFCKKFNLDTQYYAALKQPLLSYGFVDDEMAPEANVRSLLKYFPNTKSELRMADPKLVGLKSLGHSGFFRDSAKESLWNDSIDWFEKAAS